MTPYEYADLAQSAFGNAASTFAVNLTILSAYLIAAYTVGDKLTRTQLAILNVLFVLSSAFTVFTIVGFASSGVRFAALAYPEVVRDSFFTAKPWSVYALGAFNAFAILAAVYFMSSTRNHGRNVPSGR